MARAFMSYSSIDRDFATRLHDDLEAEGVHIWRDRRNLNAGDFWDSEIENALADPELTHVIVLISPHSVASEMVRNEVEFAAQQQRILIPARIADTPRRLLRLARRHEVDFRDRYEEGLSELIASIRRPAEPTILNPIVPRPGISFRLTQAQILAARDTLQLIRLVAAPGTGKSLVIEERVRWLLEAGVRPDQIAVTSFTRAASRDLEKRIQAYCHHHSQPGVDEVRVTTLHSLALRVLRKAGRLHYPVSPRVLDQWETENIFDLEFSAEKRDTNPDLTSLTPKRAAQVRAAVEAYWNTGEWNPPDYMPPDNPVTEAEIAAFWQFHGPTTQTYSCVLPGEIIMKVVDGINAGNLSPAEKLGTNQLIIDEYQDLNYTDQRFVESFIDHGCSVFVAGDDDQSIYAFRYAYPQGIQEFTTAHPQAGNHTLSECFRCTPHILNA